MKEPSTREPTQSLTIRSSTQSALEPLAKGFLAWLAVLIVSSIALLALEYWGGQWLVIRLARPWLLSADPLGWVLEAALSLTCLLASYLVARCFLPVGAELPRWMQLAILVGGVVATMAVHLTIAAGWTQISFGLGI